MYVYTYMYILLAHIFCQFSNLKKLLVDYSPHSDFKYFIFFSSFDFYYKKASNECIFVQIKVSELS